MTSKLTILKNSIATALLLISMKVFAGEFEYTPGSIVSTVSYSNAEIHNGILTADWNIHSIPGYGDLTYTGSGSFQWKVVVYDCGVNNTSSCLTSDANGVWVGSECSYSAPDVSSWHKCLTKASQSINGLTGKISATLGRNSNSYKICMRLHTTRPNLSVAGNIKYPDGSFMECNASAINYYPCFLKTSLIDFDFGTVEISKADGLTLDKELTIECSGPQSITLDASGLSYIPLSNGLTADITFNDKALKTPMDMPQGATQGQLRARLKGTTVQSGPFSGSGVLMLYYN